jgi:hypothetical protein
MNYPYLVLYAKKICLRLVVASLFIFLVSCSGGTAEDSATSSIFEVDTTITTITTIPTTTTTDPAYLSGSTACNHIVEKIYFDPWGWDVYDIKSDAEIDFGKTVGGTSYGIDVYLRKSFRKYIAVYENAIAMTSSPEVLQAFGNVASLLKNYLDSHSYIPYPDFESSFDSAVIQVVGATRGVCIRAQSAASTTAASRTFKCKANPAVEGGLKAGDYSAPPKCLKPNTKYFLNVSLDELSGGVGGLEAVREMNNLKIILDATKSPTIVNDIVVLARSGFYQGNITDTGKGYAVLGPLRPESNEVFRRYLISDSGPSPELKVGSIVQLLDEKDFSGGPYWIIALRTDVEIQGRHRVVGSVVSGFKNLLHHIDEEIGHGERSVDVTVKAYSGSCCVDVSSFVNLLK